tara:strand:- start:171 stop:1505 length:1335 start_codon:yes stop_codon:yes gene_type:complete
MSMDAGGTTEPQVQVRFTTKLEARFRVTEAPIQLPTRLTRHGLSEVINHLLNAEKPAAFDFVTEDGSLLRGSLAKYLKIKNLSGESVIALEYIELMAPPEEQSGAAHDDWVAAVASRSEDTGGEAGDAVLLSGCYNNSAYVRDAAGAELAELSGHTGAVKGVAWLPGGGEGGGAMRAVSASKDRTLRVWTVQRGTAWSATCEAVCSGHMDSVEAVAASPAGDAFCSAGWDGTLKLWDASAARIAAAPTGAAAAEGAKPKRAKRAEGAASSLPMLEPTADLLGHSDCVSGVVWPTAALAYSCSWDGSLKEWDVPTAACSTTLHTSKAASCLDVSLLCGLIASGHTDHVLRLWDVRCAPQSQHQLSLKHKGWVSAVAWSRHRSQLLLSSCHDGSVRLWDTRSTVPLHELPPHADKALCVAWDGAERLVSGGADGELRAMQLRLPAA